MKRFLLIAVFINCMVLSYGQSRINFCYGFTRSDLDWHYYDNNISPVFEGWTQKPSIGMYSELEVEYFEAKYFSLISGVGLYQKGASNTSSYMVFKWYLDYFTCDTKLKIKYQVKKLSPYIVVGPRVDYLVRYSNEFDQYNTLLRLNYCSYGLRYGGGIQYDTGGVIIGLGWQNNLNLNPVAGKFDNGKFLIGSLHDKTMLFRIDLGFKINTE